MMWSDPYSSHKHTDPDTRFLYHPIVPADRRQLSGAVCAYVCVYLLSGNHGDDVDPLLPHHLPEVGAGVGQRALGGNVVPLLPSDHHLGEAKPNTRVNSLSMTIISFTTAGQYKHCYGMPVLRLQLYLNLNFNS